MKGRAAQLDGLRAVAMMAICWDHWRPEGWTRVFPFEVCLFFFLVMTGYLITGSLLRQRDRSDAKGVPWRKEALKNYQVRRGLRILAPYYAALGVALLVWAPDFVQAPWWYVFHLSNIHMASLPAWPPGTNHFWSLSMQQQFYLIWPFVIWFTPRRWLWPVMLAFAAAGPATRSFHGFFAQWWPRPDVLTWASLDYFGIGGLFALAVHRGMSLESPGLRWISILGCAAYITVFGAHVAGWQTFGLRPLQQTFLSVALCGFIAAGTVGFSGLPGRWLEHKALQRIGQVSYGIYLFHNLAPMVTGKILPFLWHPFFKSGPAALVPVAVFAAVTWALTLASWRWIEEPLQGMRSRMASG